MYNSIQYLILFLLVVSRDGYGLVLSLPAAVAAASRAAATHAAALWDSVAASRPVDAVAPRGRPRYRTVEVGQSATEASPPASARPVAVALPASSAAVPEPGRRSRALLRLALLCHTGVLQLGQ
jgi:hypothetical protein